MMKLFWRVLIALSLACLICCIHAFFIHGHDLNLRGILVYTAILAFAILGAIQNYGPIVFGPLLAAFISVSIVASNINAVAQLLFSVMVGLFLGFMAEVYMRRKRT